MADAPLASWQTGDHDQFRVTLFEMVGREPMLLVARWYETPSGGWVLGAGGILISDDAIPSLVNLLEMAEANLARRRSALS